MAEELASALAPKDHRMVYAVWQAGKAVARTIDEVLEPTGLTLRQYGSIEALAGDHLSSADLARVLGLTPQTVNVIVKTLVAKGLVEQAAHPVHKKIKVLSVTASGHAAHAEAGRLIDEVEARVRTDLGGRGFADTRLALWQMVDSLDGFAGGTDAARPTGR